MSLYQPQIVFPTLNETIDATATITFYCVIRGTQCVKYNIHLYDVATNTQQYTSGVITLGSTLRDGDRLNINVDMSALGADYYYWNVDLYYDTSNYITSDYYTFNASSPPSCTFSPFIPAIITSSSHEFICAYTQAEGVGVKYFTINLYNSDITQSDIDAGVATYRQTSGRITDTPNNIRYTFNGMTSGYSYKVQCTGVTQGDISFSTPLTSFSVSYIVPVCLAHPRATLNADSSITIDWGSVVSITGSTSGSVSYEQDYLYAGNVGLNLTSGAYVEFELDFSAPFTVHWVFSPAISFTGNMGKIVDAAGTNYIYLGYNGDRFYLNINGNYYYDSSESLSTSPYILGIINTSTSISSYHREVI